jgi:SAM-dependent methyltransferase
VLLAARLLELRPWELGESARAVPPRTLLEHAERLAERGARPEADSELESKAGGARAATDDPLRALEARGLLEIVGGLCRLTERGRHAGTRALEAEADRRFEELLLACEASEAYGRLCRLVHGADLCQLDVLDAEQLDHMVASLAPAAEGGRNRILDLGCGAGRLSEHLAAATGAEVLGIDRCAGAIRRARDRTRDRSRFRIGERDGEPASAGGRVDFREGDLRDLSGLASEPGPGWDAAVAVDTLYFLDDLDAAVAWIARLLAPGGRAAIFASELLPEGAAEEGREPEEIARCTRIARALDRHGFTFRIRDFSAAEHALWRRQREAALALRKAFEAEGRLGLWRLRLSEAERTLEWVEAGRVRRYFYLAEQRS